MYFFNYFIIAIYLFFCFYSYYLYILLFYLKLKQFLITICYINNSFLYYFLKKKK